MPEFYENQLTGYLLVLVPSATLVAVLWMPVLAAWVDLVAPVFEAWVDLVAAFFTAWVDFVEASFTS